MIEPSLHKRLPPQRFYWAVLSTEGLGSNPSPSQLGYLFESVLPCPVEEVHAVYARCGSEKPSPGHTGPGFIACGMRRDALETERQGALTLGPLGLPPFIEEGTADPERINLLVGEFEPASVARLRRWFLAQAAVVLLIISTVIALGLEQRAADHRSKTEAIHNARSSIHTHVLGSGGSSTVPHEIRMMAELRQLRQTRARPVQIEEHHADVAVSLAELLALWPNDSDAIHLQTEHISITPAAITLRGALPTSAEAERLAGRLGSLDGWMLQQPQLTSTRENVQASLRFAPRKEAMP